MGHCPCCWQQTLCTDRRLGYKHDLDLHFTAQQLCMHAILLQLVHVGFMTMGSQRRCWSSKVKHLAQHAHVHLHHEAGIYNIIK